MKLLVCVSKTPDTTAKISFTADKKSFQPDGVQFIMNPYDEWYALVRAIELKEQLGAGTVTVINVGEASNDQILRKALAIGADEAVRVDTNPLDSFSTASLIAEYAKSQSFDIIFLGKETIDYNGSEVGSILAGLLDLPFVSYASKITADNGSFTINRDIEGGKEIVSVATPFVISAAKGLAEQRIPNMKGIMMAKTKPLQVIPAAATPTYVETIAFEEPKAKSACKYVDADDMDTLVSLLQKEAKVI